MQRIAELLMKDWTFIGSDEKKKKITLPHTWNSQDGQNGGNNYFRGQCVYEKNIICPSFDKDNECVYLQFDGVNCTSNVIFNGTVLCSHENGYSVFRSDVTELLRDVNLVKVIVDNGVNDRVYPQKADFTFYGGIYRNVKFLKVAKKHFDLDYYGGDGVKITTNVKDGKGIIRVESFIDSKFRDDDLSVRVEVLDDSGEIVTVAFEKVLDCRTDTLVEVESPRLWNGTEDPYLYNVHVTLLEKQYIWDELTVKTGIRTVTINPAKGFFLNGKKYVLHGVSRHQDRKDCGNAITEEMMDEDMALIREMGANAIRLAHYQHSQYFYDLCDRYGIVVWTEIPYISAELANGDYNTQVQMTELIIQNYNHPSIVTWGISNEITISPLYRKQMIENHRTLQTLCKTLDPVRPTTMACYAACNPFNPVTRITDLINWNLYLGWYVPLLALNDIMMPLFHMLHPSQPFGYSEYGAEGMPNLHSARPRRGDHTEEYQAKYHEYMLHCFERHPYIWASFVWNMFDFASDSRNQGGEPGMNHKGLVTFDRKIKKDAFYAYKAFWSKEPFVHISGKRFRYRLEKYPDIKVYTNQKHVEIYADGKKVCEGHGRKIYRFTIELSKKTYVEVFAGENEDKLECIDTATFCKSNIFQAEYRLTGESNARNWV